MKIFLGSIHIMVSLILWILNTISWHLLYVFGHEFMAIICFCLLIFAVFTNLTFGMRLIIEDLNESH